MLRVGQGFDAHAFAAGDHIFLGGTRIPFSLGIAAYSDGDVLCHALADALLGSMALGDLGKHFPATKENEGIGGIAILNEVFALLRKRSVAVVNVDATIIAERPQLAPFVNEMRARIAAAIQSAVERVSVKATSADMLGFTGRGEGIAVLVNVLVVASGRK